MHPMSWFRRFIPLLALALVAVLIPTAAVAQVVTSVDVGAEESALLQLHNQARAADGDAALVRNAALDQIAREWAQHMADTNTLVHRGDYLDQIYARVTSSPSSWGENVAFGEGPFGTAAVAHDGFMNSPGHRRNILDGDYNQVGIGMVWQNGTLWTAVNFLEAPIAPGQTPPASPAPAPDPAPTPSADRQVTSGYTASEFAAVADAAAYLGMTPEALQVFGVHTVRFLNWIVGVRSGVSPVHVVVPTGGDRSVTSSWSSDDLEALDWVAGYYQVSHSDAQKIGAALIVFLVGLEQRFG